MLLIIPMNSLFMGNGIMPCATRWLTVVAVLRSLNGSTVGALCAECSGERVRRRGSFSGWLGSKGDAGLVLKPLEVEADGGERLGGGVSQCQLSSHHDDEV